MNIAIFQNLAPNISNIYDANEIQLGALLEPPSV